MQFQFRIRERLLKVFQTDKVKENPTDKPNALDELLILLTPLGDRFNNFEKMYQEFEKRVEASIDRDDDNTRSIDFRLLTSEIKVVDQECYEIHQDRDAIKLHYVEMVAEGKITDDEQGLVDDALHLIDKELKLMGKLWETAKEGYAEYRRLHPDIQEKKVKVRDLPPRHVYDRPH